MITEYDSKTILARTQKEKRIKICHLSSAHKSTDARIFIKECTSLVNNGYEVTLIAVGPSYDYPDIKVIPFSALPRLKRILIGPRVMLRMALKENADIYHLHDPELLTIALKLKRKGKNVIFDSHEHVSELIRYKEYMPKFFRNVVAALYKKYEQHIVTKIDGVIVVTPSQLPVFNEVQKNLEMVTNYPILDLDNDEHKKIHLSTKTEINRQFCFAGGVSTQWCHQIIIESVLSVEKCTYQFAGPIESQEYLDNLERQYAKSDRIEYLGIIDRNEVKALYDNSFCGIAFLSYETQTGKTGTLGNTKLFEYMQHSLPIICSDLSLWKEIVEEYDCGITVDPTSKDQIINAISFLLDNPERASQMGKNGYRAYREKYNWDTQIPNLLRVYEAIK